MEQRVISSVKYLFRDRTSTGTNENCLLAVSGYAIKAKEVYVDPRLWLDMSVCTSIGWAVRPGLRKEQISKNVNRLQLSHEDFSHDAVSPGDIGIIMNTGSNVLDRINAPLATWAKGRSDQDLAIVSDKAAKVGVWQIHNALKDVPNFYSVTSLLASKDPATLSQSIQLASSSASYGAHSEQWILSKFRFVPGAKRGYDILSQTSDFKWYLLVDDDTFVDLSTLTAILSKFAHDKPCLLGKRYKNIKSEPVNVGLQWIHGGSGIIISSAAMHLRFKEEAAGLPDIYSRAQTARYGDEHLSLAFNQVGVPVYRNVTDSCQGRTPWQTRFTMQSLCLPMISWHHLSAGNMSKLMALRSGRANPIWRRGDLVIDFNNGQIESRESWSFNLVPEWEKTPQNDTIELERGPVTLAQVIGSNSEERARSCQASCYAHDHECAAWSFNEQDGVCTHSNWFRLGVKMPGTRSGLNTKLFSAQYEECAGLQ